MSVSVRATITGLFMCLSVQVVSLPANAADEQTEILAQCRQEVADYGIPPEQEAEYVDGCVLSKGGYLPSAQQDSDTAAGEAEGLPAGLSTDSMDESLALPESENVMH
jgi:hypothetical protein